MPLKRTGWGRGGSIADEFGGMIRWATTVRDRARELRKEMTASEKILWNALRRNQLHGLHFYRQVAIDRYIADFYCPRKAVIVEVDGSVHDEVEQEEHDEVRDDFLSDRGFRILRVSNQDVIERLDDVLHEIALFCGVG